MTATLLALPDDPHRRAANLLREYRDRLRALHPCVQADILPPPDCRANDCDHDACDEDDDVWVGWTHPLTGAPMGRGLCWAHAFEWVGALVADPHLSGQVLCEVWAVTP